MHQSSCCVSGRKFVAGQVKTLSCIDECCFLSLDLREQRVRAQRLHPSGERKEERLRAV